MKKTIAVILDDQDTVRQLCLGLEARGLAAVSAADGVQGLTVCLTQKPDLIIADADIPGTDGRPFVTDLKMRAETSGIPLVPVVSQEGAKDVFNIEGVNDYIVKPFHAEALIGKIEKRLNASVKRVLVVDDSAESAELIEEVLKSRGYDVMKAHDGFEGLETAKRERPDMMILDVMLPKLNGFQVCRMLKFDGKYKDIPILVLTARAQEEDRMSARQAGADVYLVKPFSGESLLEALKKLVWD